jgi:hypothetical protein
MTNFKDFKALLQMLKVVRIIGRKNWTYFFCWGMAKIMRGLLLDATKTTFVTIALIGISVDAITTIHNIVVVNPFVCVANLQENFHHFLC